MTYQQRMVEIKRIMSVSGEANTLTVWMVTVIFSRLEMPLKIGEVGKLLLQITKKADL